MIIPIIIILYNLRYYTLETKQNQKNSLEIVADVAQVCANVVLLVGDFYRGQPAKTKIYGGARASKIRAVVCVRDRATPWLSNFPLHTFTHTHIYIYYAYTIHSLWSLYICWVEERDGLTHTSLFNSHAFLLPPLIIGFCSLLLMGFSFRPERKKRWRRRRRCAS